MNAQQKKVRRIARHALYNSFVRKLRSRGLKRREAHGPAKGLVDREMAAARRRIRMSKAA